MPRAFELRTKPWSDGLVIHIFEHEVEIGVTQTSGSSTEGAVLAQAGDWVQLMFGLTEDEFQMTIRES